MHIEPSKSSSRKRLKEQDEVGYYMTLLRFFVYVEVPAELPAKRDSFHVQDAAGTNAVSKDEVELVVQHTHCFVSFDNVLMPWYRL